MILAVAWDFPRLLSVAVVVVTIPLLALAVLTCRRPTPVRAGLDLTRLAVSVAAIVLMARITGVSTEAGVTLLASGAGLLVGVAQGWTLQLKVDSGRVLVRKSATGIAAWGIGVLAMQMAGILARTGTLRLGQAISLFGAGVLAGVILGRQGRLSGPLPAAGSRFGSGLLIVAAGVLAVAGPGAGSAHAVDERPPAAEVCELAPDGWIETFGRYYGGAGVDDGPTPACYVDYGPVVDETPAYEFLVYWIQEPFDTDAAAQVRREAEEYPVGVTEVPIGDYGYRRIGVNGDGETYYTIVFGRGPFNVSGSATNRSGLDELAAGFDANIIAKLEILAAGNAEPAPVAPPPAEPGDTDTPPFPDDAVIPGQPDSAVPSVDQSTPEPGPVSSASSEDFPGSEPDVSSVAAVGQALGGLVAAAIIGLISAADAGLLSASLVGRGRLSPGEAIAVIKELLSGNPMPGTAASETSATSGGPPVSTGAPPAGPPLPPPAVTTRTVQISGAAAEAALSGGPGSIVPIPTDQQWDVNVSISGGPAVTQGRVGSMGVVRSVGPIVRGADGSVSVSVEVDAFDPSVPVEAPPEPPPLDELPPEGPPVGELPSEGPPVGELPSEGPPVGEPSTPPEPGPKATGPELPSEPEPPEETPVLDAPIPPVMLDDREIADLIQWGIERNRSPEDIMQDLEGLNRARGGTGPIELTEPLVQVDTPAGAVTLTASEAAQYDSAVAEAERLMKERTALSGEIANLDRDAAWWGGLERFPGERLVTGVEDMSTHIIETGGHISEIEAELARLSRRPDPMTWDFGRAGMATREEAFESWENRHSFGWHHDQITRLQAERDSLRARLTEDLGAYRTTAADDMQLGRMREALQGIEGGTTPPGRIDFETYPDPEEAYAAALEDWRTRDTSGRYFDEAQQLRAEIAQRESLTHVADVEPARPGDRGTVFDRSARELARIAAEQDRAMGDYREIDRQLDAAQQVIGDIARRGG